MEGVEGEEEKVWEGEGKETRGEGVKVWTPNEKILYILMKQIVT